MEKIVSNVYYSLEEFKIPVKVAAYTLVFNLIVNLILCFGLGMGAPGLALGTSLTSLLNLTILIAILKRQFEIDVVRTVLEKGIRYSLLSVPVGALSFLGSSVYSENWNILEKTFAVSLIIGGAVAVYGALLFLIKDPVIQKLKEA